MNRDHTRKAAQNRVRPLPAFPGRKLFFPFAAALSSICGPETWKTARCPQEDLCR
jgi:hypothetical protein